MVLLGQRSLKKKHLQSAIDRRVLRQIRRKGERAHCSTARPSVSRMTGENTRDGLPQAPSLIVGYRIRIHKYLGTLYQVFDAATMSLCGHSLARCPCLA